MGEKPTIGFIGQGFIGKSYADDIEHRGFSTVRYALHEPYVKNKDKIKDCDIVFIAVPTPTTPDGFDDHILYDVLPLVGTGKVAVIKSTVLPGTTEKLQEAFPDIFVVHAPEFLTTMQVDYDVAHPVHNIIGIPKETKTYKTVAKEILSVLPVSASEVVCDARTAELFKYLRNCFFYTKNVYMNILYDLATSLGVEWDTLYTLMDADPWISAAQHVRPIHKGGRGAGGFCLIKDFAALRAYVEEHLPNEHETISVLKSLENKNIALLQSTHKDLDLLNGVYGNKPGQQS